MKRKEKNQEILQAASRCFARYGYEKTTMDDIGKLVGLNKASLYYYYNNKESIFREVILHESSEFMSEVRGIIEQKRGCRDRIIAYISQRFLFMQQTVNLNNLSSEMLLRMQPIFKELLGEIRTKEIDYLDYILSQCIETHELGPCDTKRIAETILMISDGIKQASMSQDRNGYEIHVDYEKAIEDTTFAVSLILDGLEPRRK